MLEAQKKELEKKIQALERELSDEKAVIFWLTLQKTSELYAEMDTVYHCNEQSDKERRKLVDQVSALEAKVNQLGSTGMSQSFELQKVTKERDNL